MSQSELLKKTVVALEKAGISYMLTGSFASSLQGEPRLTHDVDVVVVIPPSAVSGLIASFPPPDYYLDERAIHDAIRRQGQFNLLDVLGGDKVDFWLLTDEPFDQSRFARRRIESFEGQTLYISSPEDTIVMKLRWGKMSGGSEKQFRDALAVYELQATMLDIGYIEHWVGVLDVGELWRRVLQEAKSEAND